MAAVAKKCYFSTTSKIILFDFYSRLRTTYVDSNGRRTYGVTYVDPEEKERIVSQNLGKKPVQRLTYKAHNRWSHPEFEYLRRKKR